MSERQATTPKPEGRAGRGVKIALGVSLGLNLLVAGLIVGAMLASGPRGGGAAEPSLRSLGLGPFARALSRPDREAVAEAIDRAGLSADRRALGESLRDLRAALVTEPFDRPAAEAALARAREAAAAVQGHGHAALLDRIATMDPAERAALAERLGRAVRRTGLSARQAAPG